MKKFYVVMLDTEINRVYTCKADAVYYIEKMEEYGFTDYILVEVEGY